MTSVTDAELVAEAQAGDLEAYNRLAERWTASLYHYARRVLGNSEDARDVCQEALVKGYLNIRGLRDPAKFRSWVHHITLNLCRDRQRSRHARVVTQAYEEGEPGEWKVVLGGKSSAAPDRDAHRSGLAGVLEEILEELPQEQREAILLREYQGFTSQEIAEMTGVPPGTVRTRIFYGLKSVRKKLQDRGITETGLS